MNKSEFKLREAEVNAKVKSLNACYHLFEIERGTKKGYLVIFKDELKISNPDAKEIFVFYEVDNCMYYLRIPLPINWDEKKPNQWNDKITKDMVFSNSLENFFRLPTPKVMPIISQPESEALELRPEHYGGEENPFEPRKIIEHYALNFNLGNVIKYTLRAGKKDPSKTKEDLLKAVTYLKFEIENLNS
jgi:hypothetical protein